MSKNTEQHVKEYYQHHRTNISKFIQQGDNYILDVGCAAGNFGVFLKSNGYANQVVGIEINQEAANEASNKLNSVFCADLNCITVNELLPELNNNKLFDYIVCADVLEHLIDPWQVLSDLTKYLEPNGKIIASIPNVRHWTVWLPLLLKGNWDYQDAGIMDKTHLRFFTKNTMLELFQSANLNVSEIEPLIGGKWKLVDKYSLGLLRDFVAVQWVLVGSLNNDKK
jgi:2-polyprenyl-3-methyl-5-hydroxy-6-metoxy-1,4-benzoquinol methylase